MMTVPIARAYLRVQAQSLKDSSRSDCKRLYLSIGGTAVIIAAMALESTPPLRNIPRRHTLIRRIELFFSSCRGPPLSQPLSS